jgi:hypothetical protein
MNKKPRRPMGGFLGFEPICDTGYGRFALKLYLQIFESGQSHKLAVDNEPLSAHKRCKAATSGGASRVPANLGSKT